ncbi:uncharacterized protein [Euphorbia lathyris]|uniref:uncharacterized protein n=1 Tax=Euphorbia lathyris TaxID=212925 RepID=UPI00331378D6
MEITIDEEFEDALSFCDLPLFDQRIESDFSTDDYLSSSSTQDFFEFSTSSSPSHPNSAADSIIFCGKRISPKSQVTADYYLTKNGSNKKTAINYSAASSLPQRAKNGSRKQKVMIGLAKIPSKMELSDLRERQIRRSTIPPPMFPTVVKGGELSVVSGKGSGRKSRSWGLLRPFRCGAQDLASTMARSSSISCLRLARPWFD